MRKMALSFLLALLLVGSGVALFGSGGQSELSGDAHTIFVHDWSLFPRGEVDAMTGGRLRTHDGCALLEAGDTRYPVVWPQGTSIASEDPLTLELPSNHEVAVGQKVVGGGGGFDSSSDSVEVDIPTTCVPETGEMESGQVIIFNPHAVLRVSE